VLEIFTGLMDPFMDGGSDAVLMTLYVHWLAF